MSDIDWTERFWSKAHPEPNSGCWLWTANATSAGYGLFVVGSRTDGSRRRVYAHRHAYELAHGPIADGLYVCHRCDVPACVNPAHLFLGTHADNVRDMFAKGRAGCQVRTDRMPRGERHGCARLTEAQVIEVRTRHAAGESLKSLAAAFGVTTSGVWRVAHRVSWRHVA